MSNKTKCPHTLIDQVKLDRNVFRIEYQPVMNVIVDANISLGREAFAQFGAVRVMEGRRIAADDLRDVEILVVRSTARIDARLLERSPVKFVGSPVSGTDHIDFDFLSERGIEIARAPGSNSNSVAEYCVAALLVIARRLDMTLAGTSIGVIGVGNIGSKVAHKARTLGMRVVENDPPLFRETGDPRFRPLEEALDCDIVTLHVPLTTSGRDATHHMVDRPFLEKMTAGSILVNTSRGPVCHEPALKDALTSHHLRAAALDVWEGEPRIDPSLVELAGIATPHIAGYSLDGKLDGLKTVYRAACRFFGQEEEWSGDEKPGKTTVDIVPRLGVASKEEAPLLQAVTASCDIVKDDGKLRRLLDLPLERHGAYFDRLRKEYPIRREFANFRILLDSRDGALRTALRELGFEVAVSRR